LVQKLPARPAGRLLDFPVDVEHAARKIGNTDADGSVFHEIAEFLFAFGERSFSFPPLGVERLDPGSLFREALLQIFNRPGATVRVRCGPTFFRRRKRFGHGRGQAKQTIFPYEIPGAVAQALTAASSPMAPKRRSGEDPFAFCGKMELPGNI
jgi:hypothetical protein